MRHSIFIALEGIDGSGKSTQAKLLVERMHANGINTIYSSEPTKGHIGVAIRNIFNGTIKTEESTIAILFAADRLEHITEIRQLLNQNTSIVCDRYVLSSLAYHSVHVPMKWVQNINELAIQQLMPDITLYLDLPPLISLQRIQERNVKVDVYENLDNLRKVHENYYKAIQILQEESNIKIVDATKPAHQLSEDIWNMVKHLFSSQ